MQIPINIIRLFVAFWSVSFGLGWDLDPIKNLKCCQGSGSFNVPVHPLDPLTSEEILLTAQTINSTWPKATWMFIWITLKEPPKAALLPYFLRDEEPHNPESLDDSTKIREIPRQAFTLALDRNTEHVFELIVNLEVEGKDTKVEKWTKLAKGTPTMYAVDEHKGYLNKVMTDPMFIHRVNLLGFDNTSYVVPEYWNFGYSEDRPEYKGRRMAQIFFYARNSVNDNTYAHPLGFVAVIDVLSKKLFGLEDLPLSLDSRFGDVNESKKAKNGSGKTSSLRDESVPMASFNYDPTLLASDFFRKDVNPIEITQPAGASYKVQGMRLEWQKFKIRLGFNSREGLVLHNINYNDNGTVRPLIYRAAVSELFVPYGDPSPPFHRKMAFDAGQYGLGFNIDELHSPIDCKGVVHFINVTYNDKTGHPVVIPNGICLYEEDAGILWKKTNQDTNRCVTARSQRLVITFVATLGNYDYQFSWYFYQDASIKFDVKLTGMVSTNLVNMDQSRDNTMTHMSNLVHGTLLAPHIKGQYHQHMFTVRIDAEIDGNLNSVYAVDVIPDEAPSGSKANPYGNGFSVYTTRLNTSSQGRSKTSPKTSRTWLVSTQSNRTSPITRGPMGWKLIPENGPPSLLKEDSVLHAKSEFVDYDLWVTPYKEDQLYAGGFYLNNSGLPEWIRQDPEADIRDKDLVIWHILRITHIPRLEDFPVMPVETVGFWLKPANFFRGNPALDIQSEVFQPKEDS